MDLAVPGILPAEPIVVPLTTGPTLGSTVLTSSTLTTSESAGKSTRKLSEFGWSLRSRSLLSMHSRLFRMVALGIEPETLL